MKKSLIAMALVCGVVALVASCGGSKNDDGCKCRYQVQQVIPGGGKVDSQDYTDTNVCQGVTPPSALGTKDAENPANKGGHYVVTCD